MSRGTRPPGDGDAVVCSALDCLPMYASAPPVFHPPSSPLGRAVRRYAGDERQAEGLYAVAAALVLVAAVLVGQGVWLVLEAAPLTYGIASVLGWGLVAAVCFAGWRPRLRVWADGGALRIGRGRESLVLPLAAVESAERVPAADYHRHWRHYAATRAFINRLGAEVLLLRTERGPVVLGLDAEDLARFEALLAPLGAPAVLGRAA